MTKLGTNFFCRLPCRPPCQPYGRPPCPPPCQPPCAPQFLTDRQTGVGARDTCMSKNVMVWKHFLDLRQEPSSFESIGRVPHSLNQLLVVDHSWGLGTRQDIFRAYIGHCLQNRMEYIWHIPLEQHSFCQAVFLPHHVLGHIIGHIVYNTGLFAWIFEFDWLK